MKSRIKFGPAGLGSVKEAVSTLEKYKSLGFKACEIAFTYGVYIKNKEDAERIGETAKKLGIELTIHGQYWINLNSAEKEKIENSKKRILECCKIGTYLGATRVIFHAGFYGKDEPLVAYENIKRRIIEIQKEIKRKGYTPKLAPEIMGKINVFGSIEEIYKLSVETGCDICIDFAHILARYKKYNFKEVLEKFKDKNKLHIHFSGIEYGEKGERRHVMTPSEGLKELLKNLPKDREIIIINESPDPIEGALMGVKMLKV